MSVFEQFSSVKKLHELALSPVDLSKSLTPERLDKYRVNALGFDLLFGTERIDEPVLSELLKLASEARALEKMIAMQSGEVINKIEGFESENRSVLHTAMRDVFGDRQASKSATIASQKAEVELKKLENFLSVNEGKFTDLIQVGIGGSDLGPRALCLALEAFQKPNRRVHFISNVDPDDAKGVISKVDLKKTLVVVVSKSGTTMETLTNENFVRIEMKMQGIDPKNHFVAVTGEPVGGKLGPMHDKANYLESFYMWDYVGGRYSATSMVGAVALSFSLGFEAFQELLRGAHDMDHHAIMADPKENLPLIAALLGIWNRNFLKIPTVAIIPYSQALHRFPAHLQQLDMESNGKRIEKTGKAVNFSTGPVIWGEPGTNGQHSFYQLIHQGTDPIALEFIGFKKCQRGHDYEIGESTSQEKLLSNLFAQSIALAVGQSSENPNKFFPGNRPNSVLLSDKLDPYRLGALLSYYENKVAFQGFIWNINSFDQEGVQLGKKLAVQIIDLFIEKRTGKKAQSFPTAEFYLGVLEAISDINRSKT